MQEGLVTALVRRVVVDRGHHPRSVSIDTRNARGGIPAALSGLEAYVADVVAGREDVAPIVVVAIDSDCDVDLRRSQIEAIVRDIADRTCVVAVVPDPYIERWYLLDLSALKAALGEGPPGAYPFECEKSFYKRELASAVEQAGLTPSLGGYEYADLIVAELDLYACGRSDPQFRRFVEDLTDCLARLLGVPA